MRKHLESELWPTDPGTGYVISSNGLDLDLGSIRYPQSANEQCDRARKEDRLGYDHKPYRPGHWGWEPIQKQGHESESGHLKFGFDSHGSTHKHGLQG